MIWFLLLFCGLVVVDQVTKWATWYFLPPMNRFAFFPYGGKALFADLAGIDGALVNHANKGAAFGFLAEHQKLLLGFRIVLVLALFFWLLFYNKKRLYLVPLLLILAGAVSNILDYFFYGHVVDMIYLRFWGYPYPVFNLADSAICVGTGLLFLSGLRTKKS